MKYAGFVLAIAAILIVAFKGYHHFFIVQPRAKMLAENKAPLTAKADEILRCLTNGVLPTCWEPLVGPTMKKTMTPELLDLIAGKLRESLGGYSGGSAIDSSFVAQSSHIHFTMKASFEKDPSATVDFEFARKGSAPFLMESYEVHSARLGN